MTAVLELHDLRITRGGRAVLRGVSLQLKPGEVLGVLGPSGAGKSTLFRCLSGSLSGEGRITLHAGGREHALASLPTWQRARLGLGVMPQESSVLLDLTCAENLQAFADLARPLRSTPLPPPHERAASVGLEERLAVRARDLSAGERRRLEFLRATSHEPRVLLCDEPFAGVDPQGAKHLATQLRALADAGAAVMLADHHVDEALAICDRALLLLDGSLAVEAASADDFRAHPLVIGRYLGTLTH